MVICTKVHYQYVKNNFWKLVAMETSHWRVSSCINLKSLGKAISLYVAMKMENIPDNIGIDGFASI